jgi:dCMP deaminase
MTDRISRDAYGLKLAEAAASRADCTRRQVGAVIVNDDGDIVATGYNGAPAGEPGCLSDGACPRGQMSYEDAPAGEGYEETRCIAIHAEVNAVIRAGRTRAKGATIYVTDEPCYHCSIVIRAAGIVRVVTPSRLGLESSEVDRTIAELAARSTTTWPSFARGLVAAARRDETPYVEGHLDPGYSATAADVFVAPKHAPVRWKCFTCGDSGSVLSADGVDQELCPDCSTPRVFTADDPEPTDVAAVRDTMGFTWKLNEGGWDYMPGTSYPWYVVRLYAPLTEVLALSPAPRVWHAGDEEPADVQVVRDKDGDEWRHIAAGWTRGLIPVPWEHLVELAPLTEVFPSGKDTR